MNFRLVIQIRKMRINPKAPFHLNFYLIFRFNYQMRSFIYVIAAVAMRLFDFEIKYQDLISIQNGPDAYLNAYLCMLGDFYFIRKKASDPQRKSSKNKSNSIKNADASILPTHCSCLASQKHKFHLRWHLFGNVNGSLWQSKKFILR